MQFFRKIFPLPLFLFLHFSALQAEDDPLDKIIRISTQLSDSQSALASIHALGGGQSGGLTNLNFKVDIDSHSYFIRCSCSQNHLLGSSMEMEWRCSKMASAAGLAPKTLLYDSDEGILVTDFVETHGKDVNLRDPSSLLKFCALVKNLHNLDIEFPNQFCPFESIGSYVKNALEAGAEIPDVVFSKLLPLIVRLKPKVKAISQTAPCHLDLHHGNVLDDGDRMWLIDWEYSAMGDPYFDLATVASTENFSDREMQQLLQTYLGGKRPEPEEFSRLYLMRILADARWALWCYLQAKISPIDFEFKCWGKDFLEQSLIRLDQVFPEDVLK